ncbi:alpha/beta fold hydrolase [Hyphomonas sp. NPDC076900]|uniref:alpha/beta fold hydrolase n=1 Tax=unclassified Hyphomonas TaxID=2630699 RepID=UPI003D046E06
MRRLRRSLTLASTSLCLVLSITACATHQPVTHASVASGEAPAAQDRFVDALGVRMRFQVIDGSPIVVLLEAGSGLDSETWNETARMIADETGATVISYDRAGMGQSTMPSGSYDIYEEAVRLRRGLLALGQADNLVMVGHSYGGFLIHLYANLYPESISGMVYVDANTPPGIDGIGGPDAVTAPSIRRNDVEHPTRKQRTGLRLSRGFAQSMETVRRYPPLCDVPTVIISAGRYPDSTPRSNVEGWQAGHRELAQRSGGMHVIAQEAGHMVHLDDPDIIVEAVQYIVEKWAGQTRPTLAVTCPVSG